MKEPGTKPSHPIVWVSEKQRKAFFASEGFGGGVPHRRTDMYVRSWKIEKLESGYRLVNTSKGAKFVGGDAYGHNQSPIHQGRWNLFRDVADDETNKLPQEISNEIKVVARRNGLMP